jgi:hypothetical protein
VSVVFRGDTTLYQSSDGWSIERFGQHIVLSRVAPGSEQLDGSSAMGRAAALYKSQCEIARIARRARDGDGC